MLSMQISLILVGIIVMIFLIGYYQQKECLYLFFNSLSAAIFACLIFHHFEHVDKVNKPKDITGGDSHTNEYILFDVNEFINAKRIYVHDHGKWKLVKSNWDKEVAKIYEVPVVGIRVENMDGKTTDMLWVDHSYLTKDNIKRMNGSPFFIQQEHSQQRDIGNQQCVITLFYDGAFQEITAPCKQFQYLLDYKVSETTLKGGTPYFMTPFLRNYQMDTISKYINDGSKILDIGIGSGRSSKLWKQKHLQVYGVEPDINLYETLLRKNIQELKDSKNWKGQDQQIQTWISKGSMDVVMMVYSITFFFESKETLTALVNNIRHSLKSKGLFILIGMDGDIVSSWDENLLDNDCFNIIHANKVTKNNDPYGKAIEISIKNPHTLVDKQTEYLVNFDTLLKLLPPHKVLLTQHVKAPIYLTAGAKLFAEAQKIMVIQLQ